MIRCLFGLHRWRWFSVEDVNVLDEKLHVSQCTDCSKLAGGWLGRETQQGPRRVPQWG